MWQGNHDELECDQKGMVNDLMQKGVCEGLKISALNATHKIV